MDFKLFDFAKCASSAFWIADWHASRYAAFRWFFTISNCNYGFDEELTRVFYDGQEVGSDFLNENIVVRFVTNRDGLMVRIEVLGPIENIMALEES